MYSREIFPIHDPANKERLRSFESRFLHKNEFRVPDWITVPLSPDLGRYYFTSNEFRLNQIIFKFPAAFSVDTGRALSGLKIIHGKYKIRSLMR